MTQTFKEYLRPKNGYTEGPMSLVVHNGILFKLDVMFELSADLPVTMIQLDDLRWQVQNLQADEARVKKTDIKVPIIVTPQNGQYIILDGTHRVLKALKAGEKSIPARVIFQDILAISRLGSGSDVAWASNVQDQNPYLGEETEGESQSDEVIAIITSALGKPANNKWDLGKETSLIIDTSKPEKPEYKIMIAKVVVNHHNGNASASDFIKSLLQTANSLIVKHTRWKEMTTVSDLEKLLKIKAPRK